MAGTMRTAVHNQAACGPDLDHARLVERLRKQDEAAFGVLYLRYCRYLTSIVFRLLGADDEIDDVLQESFVDAVNGIDTLKDSSRLRWWLATIAVRRVSRVLSSRRRRRNIASDFAVLAPKTHSSAADHSLL